MESSQQAGSAEVVEAEAASRAASTLASYTAFASTLKQPLGSIEGPRRETPATTRRALTS
jgi:hypothetical protein